MYNSTEIAEPKAVQLPVDKTRRKRLKVVSACSECRRKKTKCNGEKPCAGCIKANVDCKYSNPPKSRPSNNRPLAASSSPTSASSLPPQSQQTQQEPRFYQPQPQQLSQSNDKSNTAIQAIENRLSVIEDILQTLLKQQQQRYQQQQQQQEKHHHHHPQQQQQQQQQQQHQSQSQSQHHHHHYPIAHQYHQRSAFVPVEQRNMQAHHSGPYYGDYHHDDGGNNYRQTQPQKRRFDQVQQQTTNVRLPPPHNYQPSLSESSSTSTTSSICSSSSPKMNTIQALLNAEGEIKLDYPHGPSAKPSAFYRPAPTAVAASAEKAATPLFWYSCQLVFCKDSKTTAQSVLYSQVQLGSNAFQFISASVETVELGNLVKTVIILEETVRQNRCVYGQSDTFKSQKFAAAGLLHYGCRFSFVNTF
ncbi:hypothetical protein BD408DRAFT_431887 [Parasitella parasitica]|nr:hypothetical protein BD408DRAFT_431887 [Parasitella parasitica]